MKKRLALILAAVLGLSALCACKKEDKDTSAMELSCNQGIGDQTDLFGICYEPTVRYEDPNFDVQKDVVMLKNLGVKSMRLWMHFSHLLASPTKIASSTCTKMHELIAAFQAADIQITGLNHTNFNDGTSSGGKPKRDISSGAYYVEWLEDYQTSWKTLAAEFPEITRWEIENETNGEFCNDLNGKDVYSIEQKSEITVDMLYYASLGIHEANESAQTVIGGPIGLPEGKIKSFYEEIYEDIKSGEFGYRYGREGKENASKNPDDYFQIACWHPYVEKMMFSKKSFKKWNDDIYQVILDNEGKHKKVIFSEAGFSNRDISEDTAAKYLRYLFEVIQEEMPYVETVQYYKLYDYGDAEKYWTKTISRYGLFYDPIATRKYTNGETEEIVVAGAPKKQALVYQELAGGSGEINVNKITVA